MSDITKVNLENRLKIITNHPFADEDIKLFFVFGNKAVKLLRKGKECKKPMVLKEWCTFKEMSTFLKEFIALLDNIPTVKRRVEKSFGL